jgi:hypothetical protein
VQVDLPARALAERAQASSESSPARTFSSSENIARTPPAPLLVEPEPSSANAMLTPITPPPTVTTEACSMP